MAAPYEGLGLHWSESRVLNQTISSRGNAFRVWTGSSDSDSSARMECQFGLDRIEGGER
jgi:hypothetical protein